MIYHRRDGLNPSRKEEVFVQQGEWVHRCALLRKRLKQEGIFLTLLIYWQRIQNIIFSRCIFGRWDVNVHHDAHVGGVENMQIGQHFSAGRGLWMETISSYGEQHFAPRFIIGDNVNLSEYVHIGCVNHIEIGNNVLMGSKIYITDHNHGVYRGDHPDSPNVPPTKRPLTMGESVIIEDNVWIGEFATILPGVTIGYGSIIGSHTTVTHDIPPQSIAVGNPARVVKQWDEEKKIWKKV
jgi:acetyltransferase-like isoleucine patch superfamily enzyme